MEKNAITISKLLGNDFKINISRSVTVNELDLYTSRLAYYLAERWSELNDLEFEHAKEAVLASFDSKITDWHDVKKEK
ncbi:hypothetical protein [Liquorilactobacillus hordei]|uniref:Uncharacterized protein n=1 Tax=Liquorilactobacillus hordei DSM 19519 TaxID=1423759 RepID=A0A0R1MKD1_9LACO|nr:hypothetical protein [Liquorilactobacillus hordei]KRL07945.1 hypothetical protein FC92_GL001013 [Liquorilactobacillus hordei DSM 19519]QYH51108.1 hypothetical protein G6O70_00685 [Liquorilactobacillus hordei DSM 19519]